MRSTRLAAVAGAVALALTGASAALAQYGYPPPGGPMPYGAGQPYGPAYPAQYPPPQAGYGPGPYAAAPIAGPYGPPPVAGPYGAAPIAGPYMPQPGMSPYVQAPGDPSQSVAGPYMPQPGMSPYPYAQAPSDPSQSVAGPYMPQPGMSPYAQAPSDPSQSGQPSAQAQAPGVNPYVGPAVGGAPTAGNPGQPGAPMALPGAPMGQPGAPMASAPMGQPGASMAGAPGGPGAAGPSLGGMPPLLNGPGQAPPGSSGGVPANAGVSAQIGPSGVASASASSQYANLPLPPTAGGVNTDTIRFMAVGENSFTFDPSPVRIPVQQPITWVNTTTSIINIASEDTTSFDSGPLAPGESFTYTPTLIGSVPYRDKLHPWVRGVLVATNASGR